MALTIPCDSGTFPNKINTNIDAAAYTIGERLIDDFVQGYIFGTSLCLHILRFFPHRMCKLMFFEYDH